MYDVYLTCIDDDEQVLHIQSRIRIEYFSFEQQTMNNEKAKNQMKTKMEQKTNKKTR